MVRSAIPALAALALACPAAAQAPSPTDPAVIATQARDAATLKRFPPPGRMIDVGGRRLHIDCRGKAKGATVIIETGAVASGLYYGKAHDAAAAVTRTCAYDRAGQGWSDPAPMPRSLEARADDLNLLLRKARIRGPVILLGHSMGGLLVRIYAKKYPRNVVGMVLMESSEEGFNGTAENTQRVAQTARMMDIAINAAARGVDVPQLRVPNGPPEQAVALRASVFRAGQDDMVAMSTLPQEVARLGGIGGLGDTPLVVYRRGRPDGMKPDAFETWIAAQGRLAALSTNSIALVAEKSGHNINYDQPELYGEAVRRVMEMRRR